MTEGGEAALLRARESGLVRAGEPLVVLLSGGADSVCLLDVSVRLGAAVTALHVNHGLREEADEDERYCAELCERLGVRLTVERLEGHLRGGNLQAAAREARYAAAEAVSFELDASYAAAHTRSDQAETVLYRLATSPGRRSLLGMSPRRGRLVRPLLEATRAETREYCRARGLAWREDDSNRDPRFARARVRAEVMPVLAEIAPAAEATIAETARRLRDEQDALEHAVDLVLGPAGPSTIGIAELRALPPALAALVVRRLFEQEAPAGATLGPARAREILELGREGGSAALDLEGGTRALVEYGVLRFATDRPADAPGPVTLRVPGTATWGSWHLEARLAPGAEGRPDEAVLDSGALGGEVVVRSWRDGDRMRPVGLGGSKSLQDLFVDGRVPRALRRSLPIAEARGEIAWVAGVAVGEGFASKGGEGTDAILSARRSEPAGGHTLAPDA